VNTDCLFIATRRALLSTSKNPHKARIQQLRTESSKAPTKHQVTSHVPVVTSKFNLRVAIVEQSVSKPPMSWTFALQMMKRRRSSSKGRGRPRRDLPIRCNAAALSAMSHGYPAAPVPVRIVENGINGSITWHSTQQQRFAWSHHLRVVRSRPATSGMATPRCPKPARLASTSNTITDS